MYNALRKRFVFVFVHHQLMQNLVALFVVFNLVDAQSMGAEEVVFTAQVLFKPFLLHWGERRWHSS